MDGMSVTPPDSDTTTIQTVDSPALSPQQWLGLARDAHTGSQSFFDSSVRRDIIEDMRQASGLHPTGSKYYSDVFKTRSRLNRPKTRAAIRKNEAVAAEAFFSTTDVISITAEADDDDQAEAGAQVMQALLQYRLTKSIPWFLTLIGAYQEAQTVGVVCSMQDWTFNRKKGVDKPTVKLIPVENIRVHPACDWTDPIKSSPYVIHEIPMYVKDVKARCKSPSQGMQAKWLPVTDGQLLASTKKNLDPVRQTREGHRQDSKDQATAITDFSIAWVHRNIIEVDGDDWVFYTLGNETMLSVPEPIEHEFFHGMRPYVMGIVALEAHKLYPGAVPRMTRDIAAEINEIANQRIDNVKFAMNKRWLVKRGRQVDIRSLQRNVPSSVTLMENTDDVKVVDVADVTSSAYQEQDRLNLDFDDLAGNFSQSSVQSNRNLNETVGGMGMLTDQANQIGGYQLRTFVETWVEPVLRQLVMLEGHYETDDVILSIAARAAKLAGPFDDSLLMHDMLVRVNVGMGATSPKDKLANLVAGFQAINTLLQPGILEQYGLKASELIREVLGVIGFRDSDRFFDTNGQDATVTSLKSQLQKAQDALASKMPPELLAAQVALVQAQTKTAGSTAVMNIMKTIFAGMQGAQVVAQVPQIAPIADQLMVASGYQDPSPAGDDPNFPGPGPLPGPAPADPNSPPGNAPALPAPPNGAPVVEGTVQPGHISTDPEMPALPKSPDTGFNKGIETTRSDSVR